MKRYFIIGTDTDCGKTYITTRLVNYFAHSAAIKPIASGCEFIDNKLVNHDAQMLHEQSGLSLDLINPWRFKRAVSPNIAASSEGVTLSISEVAHYCTHVHLEGIQRLFIEGAGGLMVPLNKRETWVDVLQITEIPVILVVGMKLGCMNHALLTEAVLQAYQIPCVGWIANCIDPNMQAVSENRTTLMQKLTFPLLATVPFQGDILSVSEPL